MTVPLWAWVAFIAFVLGMVALDMRVFHRRDEEITLRQAGWWSAIWIGLALCFAGVLLAWRGGPTAQTYLASYLIEKSLSIDNVFVFALIFSTFATPVRYQHRVLMYGIAGALIMRGAFIAGGAALLDTLHATLYVFGALLLYTAYKVLRHSDTTVNPARNLALRAIRGWLPMTSTIRGSSFVTHDHGKWKATPLLAVLIVIETADVVFALDSIPAVFAITRDTFVVFTSNAFALLGMRALYFLLAGAAKRFRYLQRALGAILAAVGIKLLLTDIYHVPVWASLAFIASALAVAIGLSLQATTPAGAAPQPTPAAGAGSSSASHQRTVARRR